MGVRFGDDADARPTRMAEHRDSRAGCTERLVQQWVATERGTQRRGVVAELPDLGCHLVRERQDLTVSPYGAARESRIGACFECRRDDRVVEVETVVAHEEVQPGGVPPSHLEPIQARQRDLDGGERVHGGFTGRRPRQIGHRRGGSQAVVLERPPRRPAAPRWQRGGLRSNGYDSAPPRPSRRTSTAAMASSTSARRVTIAGHETRLADESRDPGYTPQHRVRPRRDRGPPTRVDRGRRGRAGPRSAKAESNAARTSAEHGGRRVARRLTTPITPHMTPPSIHAGRSCDCSFGLG